MSIAVQLALIGAVATPEGSTPPPVNLPITFTLNNISAAASFAAPNVSYSHPFADGDVPAGGSVTLTDSIGNPVVVQMDAVKLHPSGCVKWAVLSHPCAETFAGGASKSYTLNSSATAPNKTVNAGLWGSSTNHATWAATLAAHSDFKTVDGPGFDAGSGVYTTSVNFILANYTERVPGTGYGSNYPTGGWEMAKIGPNCLEFYCWQYIKNDASGFFHGYVRRDIWVKAWSPTGPYEVDVQTTMPDTWNTITSTTGTTDEQYNQSMKRWITLVQVKNGSTVIKYDGGPNDINAVTVPNAKFNTTTNQLAYPINTFMPQTAVVFTSTGALPSGLAANTLYFPAYQNGADNPLLATVRQYQSLVEQNGGRPAWQASHSYVVNDWIQNNNIQYICITAGVSASSGGPTGGSPVNDITDGTVHWQNVTMPLGSTGSGTITAYPVSQCYPQAGFDTAGDYGDAIWSGTGTRPTIVVGHNFNYLTQISKFTLTYNINAGSIVSNLVQPTYLPARFQAGMLWAQSTTGASGQRIGHINAIGVQTLYQPADPWAYYGVIQGAHCWAMSAYAFIGDEKDGTPLHTTNGPGGAGGTYPGLASNITNWTVFNVPGSVSPGIVARGANWSGWNYAIQYQNGTNGQYYADNSHVPNNAQIAYLKTGRPLFLKSAIYNAAAYLNMVYQGFQTLGGNNYYCLTNGAFGSCQLRGWAWAWRTIFNTFFMMNDDHIWQPVFKDCYEMNMNFEAARISTVYPAAQLACGVPDVLDHDNGNAHIAPWMMSFYLQTANLEGWRGGQTSGTAAAAATMVNFLANWWTRYDAATVNPAAIYYFGAYDNLYAPASQDWSNCYPNSIVLWSACSAAGFFPPPWMSNLFDYYSTPPNYIFQVGFPGNTDSYQVFAQAACKMATLAVPGNTTVAGVFTHLKSTFSTATGISATTGCIQFYGTSAGVQQTINTHAAF